MDNGDLRLSPWITPARIDAEGMLVVRNAFLQAPPEILQTTLAAYPIREETFAWPRSKGRPPLVIRYAVIPPKPSGSLRHRPSAAGTKLHGRDAERRQIGDRGCTPVDPLDEQRQLVAIYWSSVAHGSSDHKRDERKDAGLKRG